MKTLITILIILVVVGGGWWAYQANTVKPEAVNLIATTTSTGNTSSPSITSSDIVFSFEDKGADATTSAPLTAVSVKIKGKVYNAGTYNGSCAKVTTLMKNEVSGVLCYFAGSGDEVGVFNENGQFVIKHGEVAEPSAESAAFRGNFKTLLTLN